MTDLKYQKDVKSYVESLPGVSDVYIDRPNGRGHYTLTFSYYGERKRATLATSPSDVNAVKITRAMIKRKLRLSTAKDDDISYLANTAKEIREKYEQPRQEILPEPQHDPPQEAKEISGDCSVTYSSNGFIFRFQHIDTFTDLNKRWNFIQSDKPNVWEFTPSPTGSLRFYKEFNKYSLKAYKPGLTPFHAKPAEFMVIDNQLIISLVKVLPDEEPPEQLSLEEIQEVAREAAAFTEVTPPPPYEVIHKPEIGRPVVTLQPRKVTEISSILEYMKKQETFTTNEVKLLFECFKLLEARTAYRIRRDTEGNLYLLTRIE